MRERDLSQTNVFDEIAEEAGYAPTSRTALRGLFSDKNPDAKLEAILIRHYGAPPDLGETEKPGPSEERAGLIEAIADGLAAQTAVARALVEELTHLRTEVTRAVDTAESQRGEMADSLGRLEGAVARLHELAIVEGGTELPRPSRQ